MPSFISRYVQAHGQSRLQSKARQAAKILTDCTLCPRRCLVNRKAGEVGYCRTGSRAVVASYNAHFGEESPLVGQKGSGTIFFSNCNLLCNFCQNFDISHKGEGYEVTDRHLADIMLSLQKSGCHNINLVTPSHVVPQILAALVIAVENGLNIPLVYNCGGYDTVDTLKILDGIIDIYMPDFKFWDQKIAELTCQAPDYPEVARNAHIEMHRQVGDLRIDTDGLAKGGLLVRHLVLPQGLASTAKIMGFIATRVSANTYVNVMSQYRPCGLASKVTALSRALTIEEYETALQETHDAGISRLDQRRRSFVLW